MPLTRSRGPLTPALAGGPVAEVDLETLALTSHAPLSGGRAPDGGTSAIRDALWLGRGRLAVTGFDDGRPAGLTLVDTRDWTTRKIDRRATNATLAGGRLLAYSFSDLAGTAAGSGVTGYSLDGRRIFRRFGDAQVAGVLSLGRRALVTGVPTIALLDGRTGRVLRRYRRLQLSLLFSDQAFPPTAGG
jgi:hypothetical protein